MTSSIAKVQSSGPSLIFTSEAAPDHAGIPFINGFPLALEESIAGFLDHEQVIDLAASKDSPLKSNPAIQKTAAVWHAMCPTESAALVETIKTREASTLARLRSALAERLIVISAVFLVIAFIILAVVLALSLPMLSALLLLGIPMLLFSAFFGAAFYLAVTS